MAHFASGVTVISAIWEGRPYAMTATAFASVSLTPPLVLVSVGRYNRFLPVVQAAGQWAVSILAADQTDVARNFARSGRDLGRQFDGIGHRPAPHSGAPLIAGALAWLDCRTAAVHPAGDHLIIVGDVRATSKKSAEGRPLAYYQGTYRTVP